MMLRKLSNFFDLFLHLYNVWMTVMPASPGCSENSSNELLSVNTVSRMLQWTRYEWDFWIKKHAEMTA